MTEDAPPARRARFGRDVRHEIHVLPSRVLRDPSLESSPSSGPADDETLATIRAALLEALARENLIHDLPTERIDTLRPR